MGLSISYYSNIKYTGKNDEDKFEYKDKCCYLYGNDSFPNHFDINKSGVYIYEKRGTFNAGSYSTYSQFRHDLQTMAIFSNGITNINYDEYDEKSIPFYELIHFSDCEGSINADICKKIFKDFEDNSKKIKKQLDMSKDRDETFWYLYKQFKKAFRVASNNGAVTFH